MKKKLIIVGASGQGKVVADIAMKMNKWEQIVFADDNDNIKTCMGISVKGTFEQMLEYAENDFFIAVGNNLLRKKMQNRLDAMGINTATLVHPGAQIGKDVQIGQGTTVMAGVVINSSTVVGNNCIVNTSSSIDHDNRIYDYVHISPGSNLAGNVVVGENSWIGIGATIINNISIVANTILGAGAVVVINIEVAGTYVGNPAKLLLK